MASPAIPAFDDFIKDATPAQESSQPVPDFKITSHPVRYISQDCRLGNSLVQGVSSTWGSNEK
jgi:hypothetical protein